MRTPTSGSRVTAVLGPTNTGKTHFAIERMLAHKSGMIGLPLRLLAREVYDKVVRIKGASQVALVTGEVPANICIGTVRILTHSSGYGVFRA